MGIRTVPNSGAELTEDINAEETEQCLAAWPMGKCDKRVRHCSHSETWGTGSAVVAQLWLSHGHQNLCAQVHPGTAVIYVVCLCLYVGVGWSWGTGSP